MRRSSLKSRAVLSFLLLVAAILTLWLTTPILIARPAVRAELILEGPRNQNQRGSEVKSKTDRPTPAADPGFADGAPHRELFRDWQKPDAVILFSGQQHGYLEPCGCSPEFQKGGLARRAGFIKSLQQKNWPVVLADLGSLLDGHTQPIEGKLIVGPEQSQAKMQTALKALHLMKYTALNLGPEDIDVPQGFVGLMGLLINVDSPPLPRAINANLGASDDWIRAGLLYPYIIREIGRERIAFIGMAGAQCKDMVDGQDLVEWQAPEKALQSILRKVTKESSFQVLMLSGTLDEANAIANNFPDLDVIIYSSDAEEPDDRPQWVGKTRKTMLVTIGSKGKYTGAIGLFKNEPRVRFELVPLDDRFDEDAEIRELLDVTYIEMLKDLDLVAKSPKKPWDNKNTDLAFVGSKKCGECHEKVYEFWRSTRHSHALDTLVNGHKDEMHNKSIAKGKHVNPECVSCHTTGFFFQTGFDGKEATQHLGGNGCENCHGPGSLHARFMSNPDITSDQKREAKKQMHLEPQDDKRNVCIRCHDHENSPKFELASYWEQIDHGAEATEDKENWPKILEKLQSQ